MSGDKTSHEPGTEPGATEADAERAVSRSSRVRVEAPAGTDMLHIAQAVVGPRWLLKAERTASANPFAEHKPLATLYEQAMRAYHDMVERMLSAMNAYALRHTDLVKAGATRRPLFTVAQIAELAQIIRDHHTGLAIGMFGGATVPPAEVKRLVDAGVLPKQALGILDDAFAYGQLLAEVNAQVADGVAKIPAMTLDGIKKRLKARPLKLTSDEEFAREWAQRSAATHVRGLGNRISQDFETMAIEADHALRRRLQATIREKLDENIIRRDAWRKLKSELGHATEDWSRDFGRIAATEKQRAMQEGQTQALIRREGGDPKSVLVAKVPTVTACDHCVRLHLVRGKGSAPRVFHLSELQANGTNIGKRAAEWKAVVGPTHPWCECALVHVPDGWSFDETGNLAPKLSRKAEMLEHDLKKALAYGDSVPQKGVAVRVGDPEKLAVIDDVIARTPVGLFTRKTGVTLITSDHPNQNSHLEGHDFAYWTGNEIRLMQDLPLSKLRSVLEHEMGHAPNVYLMYKLGSVKAVREWHDSLDAISKKEGYVTEYASRAPIENAAEVSRLYLYERKKLMASYPKQFTFVHASYRDLIRPVSPATVEATRVAQRADRAETRLVPKTERLDQ